MIPSPAPPSLIFDVLDRVLSIPVTALCKVWIHGLSLSGNSGSNPEGNMAVYFSIAR